MQKYYKLICAFCTLGMNVSEVCPTKTSHQLTQGLVKTLKLYCEILPYFRNKPSQNTGCTTLHKKSLHPLYLNVVPSEAMDMHISCAMQCNQYFNWVYFKYLAILFQGLDQTLCQLARCFYNANLRYVTWKHILI